MTMNPYDPSDPSLASARAGGEQPAGEPAPATTPLTPAADPAPGPASGPGYGPYYGQPPQEAPTTSGGATGWAPPYPAGQQPLPSYPPYEAPLAAAPRRRGRGSLLAAALLVALLIGGGLGALITNTLAARGVRGGAGTPVVIGGSAPGVTISSSVTSLEQNLQSVAAAVEPSIVKITSVSNREEATGSGDILTSDGYIVTNDHVVAGFTSYTVTLPATGVSYSAQLVGQDAQDDLAVLKIAATGLKPVAIANSSATQVGAFAIAIGYPLGGQESATFGVVSGLNRALSEAPDGPAGELAGLIQTSAQLNPGNSGGALVNLQGQLIGIPTLEASNPETRSSANGVGYAISANRMAYVVKQLIASGRLTASGQGFLGIETQDASGQGVQVAGFTNDATGASPARTAGFQQGDIITAVNGKTVTGGDDVAAAVLTAAPGTAISVTLQRASGQVTLSVTLGERPVSG